jgi:hypothetical protein
VSAPSGYPDHLLARQTAPPFAGEGTFALWHFSEDPRLEHFEPHVPATNPGESPLVWAVDTRHSPMFWFPRDCPRGCIWPVATTTAEDRQCFFGYSAAERIHVIESSWLGRMANRSLFAYELPAASFRPHDVGGYWVSERPVDAMRRFEIGDLLERHARAGIDLQVIPSLWPWWRQVIASTVEFSGHRLRNASLEPDAP